MTVINKGEIVLKYLNDEAYQHFSKKALGEAIYEANKLIFNDPEDCRSFIRYYTGANGDNNRKHAKIVKRVVVPTTRAKARKIYKVSAKEVIWLSDIHIPNHCEKSLGAALGYMTTIKPDTIILGGDFLDNEPFSAWDKKPDANDVRSWFDMAYEFLLHLRLTWPESKIIWMEGNHDNWYERWLVKKAPILWGDHYYRLSHRLRLDELGVEWVPQETKVMVGNLMLLHGHTLMKGFFSPVNAARGLFNKAKASTLIGHVHSVSKHGERDLRGKPITCWSTGCLCTLEPDYDPHNTKHANGFAHISIESNGDYQVKNYQIENGKIFL